MTKDPFYILRVIDAYIGKHLFIPLVIKFCQTVKITKEAFISYSVCASSLISISFWNFNSLGDWLSFIYVSVITFVWIIAAGMRKFSAINVPKHYLFYCRLIIYISIVSFLLNVSKLDVKTVCHGVVLLIILFMFYAEEIDTIPPAPIKEKKSSKVRSLKVATQES